MRGLTRPCKYLEKDKSDRFPNANVITKEYCESFGKGQGCKELKKCWKE